MKKSIRAVIAVILFLTPCFCLHAEEGMLPLSEIHKLDLDALGFEIKPRELYNPEGISLINGIINLSGCTASFVSPDGLILTNYHCAFNAVQAVTTSEKDYMKHGFIAADRGMEIPAKNYTVQVIESYRDVSREVLSVLKGKKKMTFAQRTRAIEKRIKQIELRQEKKHPGRRAEVAEMFIGKTYVLFLYTYVKDVRLVYAPPRSIGEYGGEIDNWMWPRHTGDFAFMRAYAAPDGTLAAYSPDNVPYQPQKYLQVMPEGVKEEDLVFILGYPGRTHRHRTADFVSLMEDVRMPYLVELYGWMIGHLETMSKESRALEIKLSARLNSLWNRMKRYKGQLQGLGNLKLADRRRQEEKKLQEFIEADPKRRAEYGTLQDQLKQFHIEKRKDEVYSLTLQNLPRGVVLLGNAFRVYEAARQRKLKDSDRKKNYMERNFGRTLQRMRLNLRNYHEPVDRLFLKEMLMRLIRLSREEKRTVPGLSYVLGGVAVDRLGEDKIAATVDAFIDNAYKTTKMHDESYMLGLLKQKVAQLDQSLDPLVILAREFYPGYRGQEEIEKGRTGVLAGLLSRLVDIKKEFAGKEFVPDANGTLRLTHGRIRGYSPRDAVSYRPFTTLGGILEKHTGEDPFDAPSKLFDLHRAADFGRYGHPGLKDVPVAMLYNADTTGGNSGSPVLDRAGRLVGLNFDRVFEATINDFGWDESYSRSIGVDIRYILWFLDRFGGGGHLLKEMNVN